MTRYSRIASRLAVFMQNAQQHTDATHAGNHLKNYFKSKPTVDLGRHYYILLEDPRLFRSLAQKAGYNPNVLENQLLRDDFTDETYEALDKMASLLTEDQVYNIMERISSQDPGETPSRLLLNYKKKIPVGTWLVHFTDAAFSILRNGFNKGKEDIDALALTKHGGSYKLPGYNFAFIADGRYAINAAASRKYGDEAVMFMAPTGSYLFDHLSDVEQQVIFWGQGVPRSNMVLLQQNSDTGNWMVVTHRWSNRDFVYEGSFEQVVDWVERNFNQYRRQIAGELPEIPSKSVTRR